MTTNDPLRRLIVLALGLVISMIGLYLVHDFGGWKLLIAIVVLTWGNNISLKYGDGS